MGRSEWSEGIACLPRRARHLFLFFSFCFVYLSLIVAGFFLFLFLLPYLGSPSLRIPPSLLHSTHPEAFFRVFLNTVRSTECQLSPSPLEHFPEGHRFVTGRAIELN